MAMNENIKKKTLYGLNFLIPNGHNP